MKNKISDIIKSKDLKDLTSDLIEIALDNQISEGILKETPLIKSIISIKSIYNSYTDQIFIKKAMTVLLELKDVNWKDRTELASELDDENESGAEKILMAINHLKSTEKCKIYGRLCRLKALKKITKSDFLRLTEVIQNISLNELSFIRKFKYNQHIELKGDIDQAHTQLLMSGLISQKIVLSEADDSHILGMLPSEKETYLKISLTRTELGKILLTHYDYLFLSKK